jgi:hypothetical protein
VLTEREKTDAAMVVGWKVQPAVGIVVGEREKADVT